MCCKLKNIKVWGIFLFSRTKVGYRGSVRTRYSVLFRKPPHLSVTSTENPVSFAQTRRARRVFDGSTARCPSWTTGSKTLPRSPARSRPTAWGTAWGDVAALSRWVWQRLTHKNTSTIYGKILLILICYLTICCCF